MPRLDSRERRTIAIGATISVVALLVAFVLAPAVRRWSEREEAIALSRARVARLRGLTDARANVVALAARHEGLAREMPLRLVAGRTSALAASELQGVLQEAARSSRVTVNRLEVADEVTQGADSTTPSIAATLSAVTDVYGLADLLTRLQRGSPLVQVTELQVTANSVLRGGELLQVVVAVRAPFVGAP